MKRVATIAIIGALALAGCATNGHTTYSAQAKAACTQLLGDSAQDLRSGLLDDLTAATLFGADLEGLLPTMSGSDANNVRQLLNDDLVWEASGVPPDTMLQHAHTVGNVCQRVTSS